MGAVKAADVERFVDKPDRRASCILVYGPDVGLVHERADRLAKWASSSSSDDPFSLVRLDGDQIASDPGRLIDEAGTTALFGGSRTIWIKLGSKSIAPALDIMLQGPKTTSLVIIEAGDLKKNAPVRVLCEKHADAMALPCYADGNAAIGHLIDTEIARFDLTISTEARGALIDLLGVDRINSRKEIEKICLYCMDRHQIELGDVELLIIDTSTSLMDEVIDAAFAGNVIDVDRMSSSLASAGIPLATALNTALRQAQNLHRLKSEIGRGASPHAAMSAVWPGLHFKRKPLIEKAVANWRIERLENAIARLSTAVLDSRRASRFGDVIAARMLISIAAEARTK